MHLTLDLLLLSSITTVLAADVWTVNCGVLSVQRSDPIISPGRPSSHVHAIVGGTAFSRSMAGIKDAVNAKATTCDKYTDHSNYELTCITRDIHAIIKKVNDSEQSNQAILYETEGTGEVYGFPKTIKGRLQLNVRFPSCWDGKNLDSPDHKSHMSYPDPTKGDTQGGMCPSTHPIALLHVGAEFGFDTGSLDITDSSTLVFSMGDTTGYGGHADFIQGWQNLTALGESFDNCNGFGDACAWNSFGTPDGKQGVKSDLKPQVPAVFEEDIGLNGPIAKLPGNNPVWNGVTSALSSVLPTEVLPTTLVTMTASLPLVSPASSVLATVLSIPTSVSIGLPAKLETSVASVETSPAQCSEETD
ncbi:hypothetical protein ONS96_009452 [Cadophora gregata f. sp. sojae]|nr:hypothetical protein ONS96_009452 [Cadophora gregata f. sp. sojae]